jgi:hypothetical protein
MSVTAKPPEPDAATKLRNEAATNAISSPDIPHIYFNEFASFYGSSDAVSVLSTNERFVAVLHMSVPVAKSFGMQLLAIVNLFEQKTRQEVLTLEEANSRIRTTNPKAPGT